MSVVNKLDPSMYQQLHQSLLHQPSRREKYLAKMTQDPIRNPLVLQPKIWDRSILYPRYTFDSSISQYFSGQFQIWWKTHYAFHRSPVENVKVKIVANTNRTLEQYFIHKKPQKALLINTTT